MSERIIIDTRTHRYVPGALIDVTDCPEVAALIAERDTARKVAEDGQKAFIEALGIVQRERDRLARVVSAALDALEEERARTQKMHRRVQIVEGGISQDGPQRMAWIRGHRAGVLTGMERQKRAFPTELRTTADRLGRASVALRSLRTESSAQRWTMRKALDLIACGNVSAAGDALTHALRLDVGPVYGGRNEE
jgi:hypothetical protein